MKILVNDYAGHAFPFELSRELARRGHTVVHAYFSDVPGPQGAKQVRANDPPNFSIVPISIGRPFRKYDYVSRVFDERDYARRVTNLARSENVDAIIVSNTPDDALDVLRVRLPDAMRIVYWTQDIYSRGIRAVLNRKVPFSGTLIGVYYKGKERRFAKRADHIVAITDDFLSYFAELGIPPSKVSIIENWAPLEEITPLPHENRWKIEQGLAGKTVILYSGTLGLKHNPELLAGAAEAFRVRDDIVLVVVSEGLGADYLAEQKRLRDLRNLHLLRWQPYDRLSEVLSSSDIVTAIIDREAAGFSVPSKILSALSAGRPLVAAVPQSNLAARTIRNAQAGLIGDPEDAARFLSHLRVLVDDAKMRQEMGQNARRYAQKAFAVTPIAARFEEILLATRTVRNSQVPGR